MDSNWIEYLEALNKCCEAVKLTAKLTMECADHAEQAGIYTGLSAFFVKEAIATIKEANHRGNY